jgi:hypothetical protein
MAVGGGGRGEGDVSDSDHIVRLGLTILNQDEEIKRLRAALARQRNCLRVLQTATAKERYGCTMGEGAEIALAEIEAAALLADPDGQAAKQWMEAKIAEARAETRADQRLPGRR